MNHILVPVDFSSTTDAVVAAARRMARRMGWPVTLLHVAPRQPDMLGVQLVRREIRPPVPEGLQESWDALQQVASQVSAAGDVECHVRMVRGTPVATILNEARRLDAALIVMGAHDRKSLFRKLLGSVSAGVLEQASCPMLVIPASGNRSRMARGSRAA